MVGPELTVLVVWIMSLVTIVAGQACGPGLTLTYAKIPNMLPRTAYPPVLLYAQAPGVAITATCYNKCRESGNCDGFIVDYKQGACYRVNVGRQYEDYQHQLNVNFFRKVCLNVPKNCVRRAWPVEYVPGYKLLAEQNTVLPNIADKWQCAQLCLNQTTEGGQICRSSQYQAWSRTCILSQYDRHSRPDSFLPTISTDKEFEYIENQCPVGYSYGPGIRPNSQDYCWRDAVYNNTSLRADLEVDNLTLEQCESRCKTEESFPCFAFTYQCPAYGPSLISRCMLHTDQLQGSSTILFPMPCTTYKERISCLDVSVSCTAQSLTITLKEKNFPGQVFVSGHATECGASGSGQEQVQLVVPLPETDYSPNPCDVQVVKSIGQENRTVVSAIVVVQHHKLIQTVSDRVVKVSCYLNLNPSNPSPPYNNLTLNASFYVANPTPVQNVIEGSGNTNNATYPPTAYMRVVDARGGAVSQVQLGDELELQIYVNPPYNVSMIRAGHLIASSGSGQDSLLLLDWRGCPPDPATFPALEAFNDTALVARFRAFKFPDSNLLRFSVILTFCVSVCQPTDCGNGLTSYGKRRRRSPLDDLLILDDVMEEVPLQLELIVRNPDTKNETSPRPQIASSEDDVTSVLVDGEDERVGRSREDSELLCATVGTTVVICVSWVVLQLCLLIGCCWAISHREKKSVDRVSLQTDFQPKHVTWGDSNPAFSMNTHSSTVRS